jgi:serine phosphatase RsbU (regulator of sigma subunit)
VGNAAIVVAAAGRPYPGETVSGDAWHMDWFAGRCRIAVIDGLGHGPHAAAVAATAAATLTAHPEMDSASALQACHLALHGTRGAAMWVATIDLTASCVRYAGVGNVEGRVWHADEQKRLVAQRGIVGASLPNVRVIEYRIEPDWTLIVHTDGIREHFDARAYPDEVRHDPRRLADALLEGWARPTDDALVLAARAA